MTWLIIGAGVSGLGAAKLLAKRGERVRVSEAQALSPAKAGAFLALGAALCDGGHALAHLDGITHVVASPGLAAHHPLLAAARERALTIVSEIDLALADLRVPLIAVTGTNGKSTTCAMIGHALAKLGLAASVGGNFGDPPTAIIAEGRLGEVLVLELSSYQLEQSRLVRPKAAVFTSFSFDHIARHGSMAAYLATKWRLFATMGAADLAVLPCEIAALAQSHGLPMPPACHLVGTAPGAVAPARAASQLRGKQLVDTSGQLVDLDDMLLDQPHNLLNAAFTIAAVAHVTGHSRAAIAKTLADFRGLAHRCEVVGSIAGRPIINDSKSTNVESTQVALASASSPVLLMLGGQGKGESYRPLLEQRERIAAVIAFGASAPDITAQLKEELVVHEFAQLADALAQLGELRAHYDAGILFSPAGASFDEFANYMARGDAFRSAVENGLLLD